MLSLLENRPLDVGRLQSMLTDWEDLHLVWPDAKYPFDPDQWRDEFAEHPQNVSFIVCLGDDEVGHAALLGEEFPGTFAVAFLYLNPAVRGKGLGKTLIVLLEEYAREKAKAKWLTLHVRSYNPRAAHIYETAGFIETDRDGTRITMRKELL
jgi:ribosomal protein S18 acetylase RimI-like enzyme